MNNIALFVKDFQKGTELSDRLATVNINITFAESIYDLPDHSAGIYGKSAKGIERQAESGRL